MAKQVIDKYAQIGYMDVLESGAQVLTFSGISVFSNMMQPKGLIIHQVEYGISGTYYALMTTAGDTIIFGLSGSDTIASIALSDPQVYDYNTIIRNDFGTAASAVLSTNPIVKDFSKLPGGGILLPADRIYLYVADQGMGVVQITCRFRFTIVELTPQDYLELVQSLRVLT